MFLISSSIFNKKNYLVIFTLLFLIAINTNCLAKNISNKESKYFYPLLQEVAKKSDEKILLNDTDIEKYKKIFSLQKLGKWEEAEDIIEQLDNKILLGHVKYQKLMHPTKYRSKYKELKDWLILYSDHPMSDKIWKLADRRKPKNTKSLKKPEKLNRLAGSGRDFKSITPLENFNIPKKYNAIYKNIKSLVKRGRPTQALRDLNKITLPNYIEDDLKSIISAGYYAVGKDKVSMKIAINAASRSGIDNPKLYWRAGLASYRLNKKEVALKHFIQLTKIKKNIWLKYAGAYWAAKIYLEFNNELEAKNNFTIAAQQVNSFYGQLAIEYLGYKENIIWEVKKPGSFFKLDILNNEHVKRALALSTIGRYGEADQEIRFVYGVLGNDKIYELLELTNYLNLPAVQLRLGDKLFQKGDLSYLALYPSPQWINNQDKKIDEVLLWSLMRKESSFYLKAKSPRSARGLLQLMPSTARTVMRDRSIRGSNLWKLYDLEYNILIGQKLLLRLMDQENISDSLVPLLMSWNAGPTRYKKWNEQIKIYSDPLLYIESIPSYETRWFVKKVLKNMWIYRDKLQQPKLSRKDLANNLWPKYKNLSF
ncbi:MAG: lytic transglycosylase domain-containing protein [Alphaproteobacteria bacterium]|nr:MAG: lytic transglycosylase domain-containing protein [Alphaproteobacteria bacterium]